MTRAGGGTPAKNVAGLGRRARRAARALGRAVGARRVVRIRGGRAEGMRIGRRFASADYRDGRNEMPVQTALADHLRSGDVAYDVGANIGFFSLVAARAVGPDGHVHAFEAVADIARAARRNFARNSLGHVHTWQVAVGAEAGTAAVHRTRHPGGATLVGRQRPRDAKGTEPVEVVRLDDLVAAGRLQPPRLVKIDVEGAELDVLEGMQEILAAHRPVIVCELDAGSDAELTEQIAALRAAPALQGYSIRQLPASYPQGGWHVVHLLALHAA